MKFMQYAFTLTQHKYIRFLHNNVNNSSRNIRICTVYTRFPNYNHSLFPIPVQFPSRPRVDQPGEGEQEGITIWLRS